MEDNKVDISLVIPTRQRLALLKLCLTSFFFNAKDPSRIEFIIVMDFDDKESHRVITTIEKYNLPAIVIIRHRSQWIIRDYNNRGGLNASGKFVWILNDDVLIETDNWDEILVNRAEEFLKDKPDRIFYGIPDDDTHSRIKDSVKTYGSCFPILSKESVEVMGGIMPEVIRSHCADTKLYEIVTRISKPRILDLQQELHMMHFCKHNGSREEDTVQKELVQVSQLCSHLTDEQYQYYIDKLNNYLNKYESPT